MSAIVIKVAKAKNASNDKPFATVRFASESAGKTKFGRGAFGTNRAYPLTYDLKAIYPEVKDDDNEFDFDAAYTLFKKEMTGTQDDVNCFDIPVIDVCEHATLKIVATDREMSIVPVATYGSKEDALRIVKSGILRQLKNGTLIVPSENEEEDEED